jgi:hypothetical protein
MIYYVTIQDSISEQEIEEYRLERDRIRVVARDLHVDLPDDEGYLSNEDVAALLFRERLDHLYYTFRVEVQS